MKASEIVVFVLYLIFMLSIGVYFFVKNLILDRIRNLSQAARRPTSSAAARWARGSRRSPPARPI